MPASERIVVDAVSNDCYRVLLTYGYLQGPNIPAALRLCERLGLKIDLEQTTYYLGRETLIPTDDAKGMWLWREHLFAFLARNALRAPAFFSIPAERVVELGIQIEL